MKEDKNSKKPSVVEFTGFYIVLIFAIMFIMFFNIIMEFKSDLDLLLISILISLFALFILKIRDWREYEDIDPPEPIKKYPEDLKMAWEYVKSADARKQQTRNYLLVAESMLLFSFVTIYTIDNMSNQQYNVSSAIAIIGIVVTLSWFFANLRLGLQISTIQKGYLLKRDRVYWDHIKVVRHQPTVALFLSNVLPCSIFLLWVYLFYFSINNNIDDYNFFANILPFYILLITGLKLLIEGCIPDGHEKKSNNIVK